MNLQDAVEDSQSSSIELTPLIDVVFQLLIFFMLTMSFSRSEYLLPVDLAKITSSETEESGPWKGLTLTVTPTGEVMVDDSAPLSHDELAQVLEEVHAESPWAHILLRGDTKASHGRVLEILDLANGLGFERVDMVVSRPD